MDPKDIKPEYLEIIKDSWYWSLQRHADLTAYNDEYESERLQQTADEIEKLCAKYPWLQSLLE